MLQRIQTIYLLISTACLSILVFGNSVLMIFFGTTIEHYELTIFGIMNQEKSQLQSSINMPLYILPILLIPLLLFAIFSYKNLRRQNLLIIFSILLYSLLIIAVLFIYFFNDIKIDDIKATVYPAAGLYILGIGFPFLFLANNGVKRDKKLLDSLNRLR